jgi:hypothetical protein
MFHWTLTNRLIECVSNSQSSLVKILVSFLIWLCCLGSYHHCRFRRLQCWKFNYTLCNYVTVIIYIHPSIHPMALQPKSGLDLLYLLHPQCSIIIGQLPVATAQKACSILLHRIFPSFPELSNWSYSFKLSLNHFLRNSCAFNPLWFWSFQLSFTHIVSGFQFKYELI